MSELVRLPSEGLLQRTRDLATMSEEELRRFAKGRLETGTARRSGQ